VHYRLGRLRARDARTGFESARIRFRAGGARALGASNMRILFTHILPNAIQPLIVQASLGMAGAVLSEASLSFLGLGIPPPAPSWGTMIEEARGLDILYNAPHVLFFPGIAIALTVLAFNFIGDGLREYLDPKQRNRSDGCRNVHIEPRKSDVSARRRFGQIQQNERLKQPIKNRLM
jgi:peptide/nickel transport system permease protein